MGTISLASADKIEIQNLQDNYIEITAMDNNDVVTRATPLRENEIRASILAEHGFSAMVKTTANDKLHTLLFDFGFSEDGAARNAETLGIDMTAVEAAALSHGHSDHTGGMAGLGAFIGRKSIPLVAHPSVFKSPRYLKYGDDLKINFPKLTPDGVQKAGFSVIETRVPYTMLDNTIVFLGEIPRRTDFEQGIPMAYCRTDGKEVRDLIEDDTSIVMHLKDKGLVILSGCAHAGIVNTVQYAVEVTGIHRIHAIMGGFHLSGGLFEGIIERTVMELLKWHPAYIIPMHCTGRKAIMIMEKAMPEQFILNMSGTKLTFNSSDKQNT